MPARCTLSAVTERRGVHRPGGDVRDGSGQRRAVALNPDRHRVRLDPVDEVDRAVDRVEHPRQSIRTAGRSAFLLAENVFTRPQFGQPVAQQPLGFGVDDRDGVGRCALRPHRWPGVWPGVPENLDAAPPDEIGRLRRQPLRDRAQQDGIGVVFRHGSIATQSPCTRGSPSLTG